MQDQNVIDSRHAVPSDLGPEALFGVCQAIGEDLGFNPLYLRMALLTLLFFSATAMIGTYVMLGGAVALSRWLFPRPKPASSFEEPRLPAVVSAKNEEKERELVAA